MSELTSVTKRLQADDRSLRIAAAMVLGAVKSKSARHALLTLLEEGGAGEQVAALEALGAIRAKSTIKSLVPFLSSPREDVRRAATTAVLAFGAAAVSAIEARRASADETEKRALDTALARLGGDDAFGALLDGLLTATPQGRREAALSLRKRVKDALPAERKAYLTQVLKYMRQKAVLADEETLVIAVKIAGFLEDRRAIAPLLRYVADPKFADAVRLEAIVALRFALGKARAHDEVAAVLMTLVEGENADLGRPAMDTLANLELDAKYHRRLVKLANHGGFARGRFVVEKLNASADKEAKTALLKIVTTGHPAAAEKAAPLLQGETRVLTPAVSALATVERADRNVWLTQILFSMTDALSAAQKKKIVAAALAAVEAGTPGYESLLKLAKAVSEENVGTALRALAEKLRKKKKADKAAAVLGLLERTSQATVDDKFRLGMLELAKSRLSTTPTSRARDSALKIFQECLDEGLDLWAKLKRERTLSLEAKFYLGFHFIEMGFPVGEELLADGVKKGGRKKIARMAKNKLKLEGGE